MSGFIGATHRMEGNCTEKKEWHTTGNIADAALERGEWG